MLRPQFSLSGFLPAALYDEHIPAWQPIHQDDLWMAKALETAMLAVGRASPNPVVGCVLIGAKGELLASAATEEYGGSHAEVAAMHKVSRRELLQGATAYVTLEPCSHTGLQPPCVQALIEAGIKRCVIGADDSNPLVNGGGLSALTKAGIKVVRGVLTDECTAWHRPFTTMISTGKPYIALKWAQTLDGHLADDLNHSQWITGDVARQYAHWLRSFYDDILVGAGTAVADEPQLTNRSSRLQPRQPQKIIFDPRNRLANCRPNDRLAATMTESIVLVDQVLPDAWYAPAVREIVPLPQPGFRGLQDYIATRGRRSVMVEGGPTLLNLFLKSQGYDCIHAFVAPMLVGGGSGKIGHKINSEGLLADAHTWQVVQSISLGSDTLIEATHSPYNN